MDLQYNTGQHALYYISMGPIQVEWRQTTSISEQPRGNAKTGHSIPTPRSCGNDYGYDGYLLSQMSMGVTFLPADAFGNRRVV
jgi:hypothetical protein